MTNTYKNTVKRLIDLRLGHLYRRDVRVDFGTFDALTYLDDDTGLDLTYAFVVAATVMVGNKRYKVVNRRFDNDFIVLRCTDLLNAADYLDGDTRFAKDGLHDCLDVLGLVPLVNGE